MIYRQVIQGVIVNRIVVEGDELPEFLDPAEYELETEENPPQIGARRDGSGGWLPPPPAVE